MRRLFGFAFTLLICFGLNMPKAAATHSMGADLSYRCLGGNTYEIKVSFYRDCAGQWANPYIYVYYQSVSCGILDSIRVNQIPNTGNEITQICSSDSTRCTHGTRPGIQEYVYMANLTLPMACSDWTLSYTQCCRNLAISNIFNPTQDQLYIFAKLNNLTVACNNSPTFSNKPVPYACVGQPFCFSHMAHDADGDSLVYSLITPYTSDSTQVQYRNTFDSAHALSSSPPISFNSQTGEICMTPTAIQVTVMAVLVNEYRNGVLIGSVERDIQITVINCNNYLPTASGIDGSDSRADTICAGVPYCFTITTGDSDVSQNTTLTWDTTIAGATFTVNTAHRSTGTFCWTPAQTDISRTPHCFSVRVKDNNCPYNGVQYNSYCFTVEGVQVSVPDVTASCNANAVLLANGSGGIGPLTYTWSTGQTGNSIIASPGQYIVTAGDGSCSARDTAQVLPGPGVPVAAFSYTFSCSSNVVNFTDNSVPASGATLTSRTWDFGDGNSGSGSIVSHTYASAGSYTVQLIVQSSSGCSDTTAMVISAGGPLPTSAFTAPSVCYGALCSFTDHSVAGAGSITSWSWQFGDGGTSTQAAPTHLYANAGSYPVTLIVQNTAGCYDTLIQPVTVYAEPVAFAGNDTSVCRFSTVTLTGTGGSHYLWTPGGDTTASIHISPVINTIYTVTVTDTHGCLDIDYVAVTVNSLPVADAGNPVTFCNGGSTTLQGTGGGNYVWMPGNHAGSTYAVAPAATTVYTVIVTNASGCVDSDNVTVTVNAKPVAFAGNDTSVCLNSNVGLTATGGGNYAWSPGGATSSSVVVSPGSTTLYTVIVTNAAGCKDTDWVNVQVLPLPVPVASNDTAICLHDSATLVASGGTQYSWSPLSSTLSTIKVAPSATTLYTVTVTNAAGCRDTNQVRITVRPLPVAYAGPDTAVCLNAGVTLLASGGSAYSWSPGGAITAGLFVVPLSTTDYIVHVSNAFGCSDDDTVRVVVHPNPVANAGNDTAICLNNSVTLLASGGSAYLWNTGANSSSLLVSPGSSAAYSVRVANAYGCADTDTVAVTVNPLPEVHAFPDTSICLHEQVILGATGGVTYSWMPGNGSGSNYPVSPAATTRYIVSVTDVNSCRSNDTVDVTVNPLPVAVAGPDTSVCAGANITLTASGGQTFTWFPGGLGGAVHALVPPSTTLYSVEVTDGNGCKDTAYANVIVNAVPDASFTAQPSTCNGQDIGLQNGSSIASGSFQQAWDFGNGFQSNLPHPSYAYSQPGSYLIHLTVTSDSGCVDRDSANVNVLPNPSAAFQVSDICEGGTAIFTNSTSGVSSPLTYSWDFGNGENDTTFSPSHVFHQSGQYSVHLTATATGCSDTVTHVFTVFPLPSAHFNGPSGCEHTPTPFTNSTTISHGSIYSWHWEFGDSTSSSQQHPTHTYLYPGNFRVSLTALTTAGCTDTTSRMIRVNPHALPAFEADNSCLGQDVQFTDLTHINPGNISQWMWQFGDGTISLLQNPVKRYPSAGTYTVTLTVQTDSGCSSSITVPAAVEIYPLPEASFTATPSHVQDLFPHVQFANLTAGNNLYAWDFGDGAASEDFSPSHDYTAVGVFNVLLVVTSSQGCIDSSWSRVEVEQGTAIYLPNSFTPNGDGDNDIYRPVFYHQATIHGEIFNRWGTLLYKWDGLDGGWDGTTNGLPAPIDVYVCRLVAVDVNGKEKAFLSNVTLVR